jgi:polysaccharide pyruvyl transferase CsaB
MANLLLAGYFGCGNLGDDAILLGFAGGLDRDGHDIVVLSGSPEETYRVYGFPSVPRKDFAKVGEAIAKCDALVFPGGSIFQDVTSLRSVAYYSQLVKKAKSQGKKVILLGQGVGPLKGFFGRRMAASAFQAADAIAVRDPASMETLKALGVRKGIRLAADCAFLLDSPEESPDESDFQVAGMRAVGLAPRPHGKGPEVAQLFAQVARLLFGANMMPVLIELDRNADGPLLSEISKQQGGKVPDIRRMLTPMHLQQRMARMEGVIAMRLHAGILASLVEVPPLMVSYDPKVTAFARMLDLGPALPTAGLTAQRVFDAYMEMRANRERNLKILHRKREEMNKLAQGNIDLMSEVLRSAART